LPESHRIRLSFRRSQQSDTYCPSRAQVKAMIGHCQASPKLRWLADVLTGLITTGLRIGELANLRWTDINLDTGMITLPDTRHSGQHQKAGAVRKTKGRRTRRVPIHARLRAILEKLPRRADGRIFSGPRGSRLRPNSTCRILIREVVTPLTKQFPTPADEVGFSDCRLHSFRHAFVSQAFLDGASEGEIREWVGHTNSRIVERYRHLHDEDAQRKMEAIDFFGDGVNGGADTTNKKHDNPPDRHEKDRTSEATSPGVPGAP
jgi:integrase